MSIIDLSFTLPMLIGVIVVLFFKRDSSKRTKVGRGIAIWLCVYTSASFGMKYWATQKFEARLAQQGIEPTRMMTAPTISNIFLWRMLAESEDPDNGSQLHVSYWSPFDDSSQDTLRSFSKGTEHLAKFRGSEETETLHWFSKDWYKIIPIDDNTIIFVDMRMGELCTKDSNVPMFGWRLEREPFTITRISFLTDFNASETISFLGQRIIGNSPSWLTHPWPWDKQNTPVPKDWNPKL